MSNTNILSEKILGWLQEQGYPLEFKASNIFRANGFPTFQGRYVTDFKLKSPREIDVVAQLTYQMNNYLLRINHVIECKWTGDKPWVIFTDENSRISTGACIVQSIASQSVEAALWFLANEPTLHRLSIFGTPDRPGFNGRQAFGDKSDIVYATLQSVVSACYSLKMEYDQNNKTPRDFLSIGVLLLPVVVIDGKLFENFYNRAQDRIEIIERSEIRLHWKGSSTRDLYSTVDIVTIDALPKYAQQRFSESNYLIDKIENIYGLIMRCIYENTLSPLKNLVSKDGNGNASLPTLLRYLDINKDLEK